MIFEQKKYRADYEQRKDKYHLVVDEPRHLLAKIDHYGLEYPKKEDKDRREFCGEKREEGRERQE